MYKPVKNPAWYDDLKALYHADRRALARELGYSVNTIKKWFTGTGRWRVPSSVEYILSRDLEVDKTKKSLRAKVNRWRRTRKPDFRREVHNGILKERLPVSPSLEPWDEPEPPPPEPEPHPDDDCEEISNLVFSGEWDERFSSDDLKMLEDYVRIGGIPESMYIILWCNTEWHLLIKDQS